MKSDSLPNNFPANPADWEKLIADAPGQDRPPTPEESAAWADAFISHGLPELRAELAERRAKRRGRGPNRTPTKERVTLRLSPDVVRFFKDGGAGWQTRIDEALSRLIREAA
ncbi:MAG: BrnA antitoxin family protein [Zoogloeaceae bacterium]|jgi:uncharacterized protein (DUF4415 family)|nr:BrnA antitoxin family protein [Zoogloeaceae bacterium]